MKKACLALAVTALVTASIAARVNTSDTRMLSQPAISATHVAFVYAGDLWSAKIDGSDVRRLTSDDGVESSPAFSPDGSQIAFSAQYEGNTDVYVVPAAGGRPSSIAAPHTRCSGSGPAGWRGNWPGTARWISSMASARACSATRGGERKRRRRS